MLVWNRSSRVNPALTATRWLSACDASMSSSTRSNPTDRAQLEASRTAAVATPAPADLGCDAVGEFQGADSQGCAVHEPGESCIVEIHREAAPVPSAQGGPPQLEFSYEPCSPQLGIGGGDPERHPPADERFRFRCMACDHRNVCGAGDPQPDAALAELEGGSTRITDKR